ERRGRDSRQERDDEARATDEGRTHLCRGHAGGPGGRGSGTRCPGFAQAGGGSRGRLSGREGRDRFRQDPPERQKCCTAAVPRHPGRREGCRRVKVAERAFEEAIECALLENGPDACAGDPRIIRETLAPYG